MSKQRKTRKRYEGLGDIRYLTCSCYQRLALFKNDAIKDAFATYLSESKKRHGFRLFAWVIMPEHFHILVQPKTGEQSIPHVLRGIKAGFAKITMKRWREFQAPILPRLKDKSETTRFWQPGGGYDRNLFSEHEIVKKIRYIHDNPVRRGLIESSTDYPWSSAAWYACKDRYRGPDMTSFACDSHTAALRAVVWHPIDHTESDQICALLS